jgi:hypothetical protein
MFIDTIRKFRSWNVTGGNRPIWIISLRDWCLISGGHLSVAGSERIVGKKLRLKHGEHEFFLEFRVQFLFDGCFCIFDFRLCIVRMPLKYRHRWGGSGDFLIKYSNDYF